MKVKLILLVILGMDAVASMKESFFSLHQEEQVYPCKSENSLRLLTWNVQKKNREGNYKLANILRDLKEIEADIILFQETFQNFEYINGEFTEIKHEWETAICSD